MQAGSDLPLHGRQYGRAGVAAGEEGFQRQAAPVGDGHKALRVGRAGPVTARGAGALA